MLLRLRCATGLPLRDRLLAQHEYLDRHIFDQQLLDLVECLEVLVLSQIRFVQNILLAPEKVVKQKQQQESTRVDVGALLEADEQVQHVNHSDNEAFLVFVVEEKVEHHEGSAINAILNAIVYLQDEKLYVRNRGESVEDQKEPVEMLLRVPVNQVQDDREKQ